MLALFLFPFISHAVSFSGLSGMLRIPSGYVGSGMCYCSFGGIKYYSYSKKMLLPNIEVGIKKRDGTDKSIFSAKMELLPDISYIPALAIGVLDINDPECERSFFVTVSKRFKGIGTKFHGGFIKTGNYKDIELVNSMYNPKSALNHFIRTGDDKKKYFFGLEKSLFNIINLMASYQSNSIIDTGVSMSISKFSVEYWKLDIRDRENFKDNTMIMVSTGYSF